MKIYWKNKKHRTSAWLHVFMCFSALFLMVSNVQAAPYLRAKGSRLSMGNKSFFIKGAAIMDDSTLWDKRKVIPNGDFIEERDYAFTAIGDINTVRLAVKMDYLIDNDGNVKKTGLEFIDNQLAWAKKYDLYMILDMHIPPGGAIQDFKETEESRSFWKDENLKRLFIKGWKEIANKYRREVQIIGYELMNEATAAPAQYWQLMKQTIAAIREVDKKHLIIVQSDKDYGIVSLNDSNILYSFHFYTPISFTLQNVFWNSKLRSNKKISYPGKAKDWRGKEGYFDKTALKKSMEHIADISKKHNVPIIVGEFAVSTSADEKSMKNWIADVVDLTKTLGLSGYIYWRQIQDDVEDLSKVKNSTMAIINKDSYYSPAQFFGIRPEFAKDNPDFEAQKFYLNWPSN